jgi:hypothetical protein
VRALGELSEALAGLPVTPADAVSARRQRQRLLGAFNRSLVESHGRPVTRRWAASALIAASFATVAVLVASRIRQDAPTSTPSYGDDRASDPVVIVPEDARWSRSEEGATTRVTLDDGELEIHVKHRAAPHGLVLSLPDGELDDVGTTFHVRVQGGRTVAIRVQEGAVVFRRTRAGTLLLGAGESWTADGPPAAVVATASLTVSAGAAKPIQSPPRGPTLSSSNDNAEALGAAKEFRDAVDLLNKGNGGAAAGALRSYLARHPGDGRAEDAAYLLVLALQRAGDEAAAAAAAREYLQRYPHGLRRREIERLAPSPP